MFKKILQSLSKSQSAKQPVAAPAPVSKPQPEAPKPGSVLQKMSKPAAAVVPTPAAAQTPEELCEITPKMAKDQIQARLKLLYRRYNRSASSLDPKIRQEADGMLDAIVRVREKHFGEI
ncbi:hypothetical protein [Prosthecobacter dejongeii]|uniref:Uncharacterized protein n=1 Tax=Prosthecobacter dejongeii TaxID=48465 RepID=A0A7W7YGR6_9BACT|nr:hypothetical protein [Prosthecobacter dejongeii]MBB5035814.1 hypothetical protein [Prosthecobacter dejongeii]